MTCKTCSTPLSNHLFCSGGEIYCVAHAPRGWTPLHDLQDENARLRSVHEDDQACIQDALALVQGLRQEALTIDAAGLERANEAVYKIACQHCWHSHLKQNEFLEITRNIVQAYLHG